MVHIDVGLSFYIRNLKDIWLKKKTSGMEISFPELIEIMREYYPKFDPEDSSFKKKFDVPHTILLLLLFSLSFILILIPGVGHPESRKLAMGEVPVSDADDARLR